MGREPSSVATMTVWALEWEIALKRRRLLAWNVAVPLLLLTPVAFAPAAEAHRVAVFAVFLVLFGTFGGCIPLVRDARSGWTEKVLLTGYGPRRWLAERLGAAAALDTLQLLPAAAVLAGAGGAGAGPALRLLPALLVALLAANLLGLLAAAAVRSLAEGALASAALSLTALHATGVFRAPAPGSPWYRAAELSPFRPLHDALRAAAGERSAAAGEWLLPAAACFLLLALTLAFAPRIAARLHRAGD